MTWSDGSVIHEADLMLPEAPLNSLSADEPGFSLTADKVDLESQLEDQERQLIVDALESTRWNKTAAAKKLGISFRSLRYKLKKLALD